MNNKKEIKISNLMKNNKYFESGIYWYYDKYLGFFWEKKLFIILFVPLICIIFFGVYLNYEKFSLKPKIVPVSLYVDIEKEELIIKKLIDKNIKNPNILVTRYLVEKYILIYESLKKEDVYENEKFILSNSSSLVYFYYKKKTEVLNEENPFLNNQKNHNIEILVTKIDLKLNQNDVPYAASASISKRNNNFPPSHPMHFIEYNIEMNFLMDNIFFINKDFDKLNFLVLKYDKL